MKFPFLDAKARLVRIMGTFDLATGHGDTMDELLDSLESELRDVLGHYREALKKQRTWVGLTDEDRKPLIQQAMMYYGHKKEYWLQTSGAGFCLLAQAIEAKLKEKNT